MILGRDNYTNYAHMPLLKCKKMILIFFCILPFYVMADYELRPQRIQKTAVSQYLHHAWPVRYSLPLPFGEPSFENFRAAYTSASGQAWLEAIYERSKPYASYIMSRIRYYGLPEELFFLPFIESEYSVKAVSRSGAMGLWQFMRNSIGGYDMRIDDWIDERRDFMKSTEGALKKLKYNYMLFGDWLLALAAYNCGAGAMIRSIRAGAEGDSYWDLREKGLLPKETAAYIPKFLAVVSVAMHGGRNGLNLSWTKSTEWIQVAIDRPVDIAMLAKLVDMPIKLIQQGNSELRYGVSPPHGKYFLKVPASYEAAVEKAIASKDVLMSVYMYIVKSGDTISSLAKYYEVSIDMICKMNPGLNPNKIRIGQHVVIPAFNDKKPYSATNTASAPANDTLNFSGTYKVVKGDTLWAISLRYGVQPEILAAKNSLTLTSTLREGMTLFVPILEE